MIRPERRTIEAIMKSSNKYSVPIYQRNFDWGKSELQELISDIKEVKTSNKELFLGNFIFEISDKTNYKIVDGQQRLTTISLIAIALRERAKKINQHEFAGELQVLITLNSSWSKETGNKINVSDSIKELFDYISNREWDGKFPEKINKKSVKRQINRIKPIFKYLTEEFNKYNHEDLISFTRSLMDTYVIVLEVDNNEDVFSIFERTNARGLDLNVGDLLKNYIFSTGFEDFEETWDEIISNSENTLQKMLKYFYISRRGHVLQSGLYKNLKNYCDEVGIEDFVNELYSFSRYYKMALSLDSENVRNWLNEFELLEMSKNEDYSSRINRVFQALKLFRITQAYPLIFSIFKLYKDSNCSNQNKLFEALECIEKYHFINNVICNRVANEVEKTYSMFASKLYNEKKNFNSEIDELINELKTKKALKEDFMSNFIDSVIYDQSNIQLIVYIYDRINNFKAKGAQRIELYAPQKELKKRNYNIEHILPQVKKKEYTQENDAEKIDKIGNLLIIPRHSNSEFQDLSPINKIKLMKSDPKHIGNLRYLLQFLEEYKSKFDKWNLETIDHRSKEIALDAYTKIWKY
jgi:uncharacterized protein with ParB-like and HNH nuclease domain